MRLDPKKKKLKELTWVTSAEVTHITTTAPMRHNPALYLQLIEKQRQHPDTKKRDLRWEWYSSQILFEISTTPTDM